MTDYDHQRMDASRALVEESLAALFSDNVRYAKLQDAMEYSLLAPGKRIRPILTLEACALCGGERKRALPFACAVEMIHCYSLIHDDLPAMDNSDLRRGRATNHKKYDEATAILAGDGLLTAAFEVLSKAELSSQQIVAAVGCLATAAGPQGMVGGQALDIEGEGNHLSLAELERLQSHKTGALITAAAELGCIAAGGSSVQRRAVARYAMALGRAFQVRDDMLDVTSDHHQMGKPTGADQENQKTT